LNEYDIESEFRCFFAVRFAKNGNYQKAINIAKSIYSDIWRDEAYQEIIREQLKQDQYHDAIQTFSRIEILRYKQQSVAIFVVYLLGKGQSDEAKKLAERFKSPDQTAIQNSETDNDPFTITPDEWNKHADIKHLRPFPSTDWQSTIEDIFASFKQLDQPDTKTSSLTESDNTISDAKLKVFLANLESMSDVYEGSFEKKFSSDNEIFHKVIKQLVKLNRTEEALPYVERLCKRCRFLREQGFYRRYYYLDVIRKNEMYLLNHHFDFSSYWNENLYYLWDAQIAVGQLDEALLTIRKLHVTDPKSCSEAHRVIAEALFEAGRIDEAKEQASLALKFAERAGDYHLDLVSTLFKIGQVAEAQLVLSKIETPTTLDKTLPNRWFKSPVDVHIERQKIDHWREILEKKE
jgi:tetratricopeptide (TPR) repeat protein